MKKNKLKFKMLFMAGIIIFLLMGVKVVSETQGKYVDTNDISDEEIVDVSDSPSVTTRYTSLGVPNVKSSFKTWMSYRAVTNKRSAQYQLINTYGWADSEGFMRCNGENDLGIDDDYYLIALGSYYSTKIGTKYKITLDTGNVFYGILADCKANIHTNSTNQYVPINGNVVEFLVDTTKLNKDVKRSGSANVYMPLNGNIAMIERIDFIYE